MEECRKILRWRFAIAALSLGWLLGVARGGAAEELRIGFLAPMTGIFAQIGRDMSNGFKMYLDEVGHNIAGAKVKFILEDSQGKPPINVRKAQKLIRQDGVQMFIGGLLASTGYALAPVSTRNKVVYIAPISAADDLTQRQKDKYPYFIRTGWTSSQPSHPFGEWACEQGYKRIVAVAADYAFGHEVVGGFQKSFEGCGGKIIQKIWPPLGNKDFGPYLPQINRKADAVFTLMVGPMSLQFPKQFKAAGLTMPLLGGGTSADEFVLPFMGKEAIGYVTALQYSAAMDTPKNVAFVKKYRQLYPSVAKKGELDGAAEGVQVMQQSVLHRLIGRHAQCQATMGTYQTAGTLDELAPQRTESEKVPQGRAFLQGQAGGGMGNHLQFPRQVVGQQHAQQVDLVPDPGARGDITHLIVGFQFGEQAFLSATTLMEHKHFACAQVLVGQDDFKLVAVLVRGEQIELYGFFVLLSNFSAHKQKTPTPCPALGFPCQLEVSTRLAQPVPAATGFRDLLEFDQTLERHADGIVHPVLLEHGDNGSAEKGGVHPHLDESSWQNRTDLRNTGRNKRLCSIGIMDITRAVQHIEHLARLGYGAKQRIVTALSFFLAVKPHGCPFSVPARADDRAIEVKRHAPHTQRGEPE